MQAETKFTARSAIEGLRAGVPNSFSVRALGCDQPRIEKEFLKQINALSAGGTAEGIVIKGDFGTGKSHALEFLRELALDRNLVVSRVYVNKETPLHDPAKLFEGAADSMTLPSRSGPAFVEIANQLVFYSQPFRDLERWANQTSAELDSRFPASLLLLERFQSDFEFRDRLIRFWAGGKLPMSEVRSRLRQIGETSAVCTSPARDLAIQRFRFASKLIRAAGYAGWVVLVDEVELIGTYSSLQRAKSYQEIARLMSSSATGTSLLPVFALTPDFTREIILGEGGDLQKIPKLLHARAESVDPQNAQLSIAGMRLLMDRGIRLEPPGVSALDVAYSSIRSLYSQASGWEPPDDPPVRRDQGTTSLRTYIRRWITEWDLRRLYPQADVDLETSEWRTSYAEVGDDEPEEERTSDQSLIDDVLGDIN